MGNFQRDHATAR